MLLNQILNKVSRYKGMQSISEHFPTYNKSAVDDFENILAKIQNISSKESIIIE